MTTKPREVIITKPIAKKKDRKQFVSISTHIELKDLDLLKAILRKEGKTIYSYLKECADLKVNPHRVEAALGLPPIPTEDDLLG